MSRTTIALLVAATGVVSACTNSTQLVATWKSPTAEHHPLTKSLAVFMTKDAGMRRMVEDKLASRIPGGVASYKVIPDSELQNIDHVRARLAEQGFDGAVVMRLVGMTTEVTPTGTDFYGYWGYWGSAYDPVYYTTQQVYSVETSVYSVKDDKLIWMGRSQTIDPKNANKLADFSVNFAVNNMRRDGIIR
ncbi:MAG TPA: hypothetical protein VJN70_18120 [Gemmatimonadaceae bacterium]|nr:hypothetical protein [Gemmatimonadaceae bacterium]